MQANKLKFALFKIANFCFKGIAWIGAHITGDPLYNKSKPYKWVHSQINISTFESWNPGEPTRGTEGCAYIMSETGRWNDNPCQNEFKYICEFKENL